MTIDELITRHFRYPTSDAHAWDDPGRPIAREEAKAACAGLTARQRAAVDGDTLAALGELLAEDEGRGGIKHDRQVKTLGAFAWFKARRSPDLERSWTTLAVFNQVQDLDGKLLHAGRNSYVRGAIDQVREAVGKRALKLDDSLDVIAVHLVGGIVGSLLLGFFADMSATGAGADGVFFGGGTELLVDQIVAVVAALAFSAVATFIIAKGVDLVFGLRVDEEEEEVGLDLSQHAETAYTS